MYNSTERNKVRMIGILPSDGMDDIPVDIQAINAEIGVFPGNAMDSLRVYPRIPDGGTQVVKAVSVRDSTNVIYTVPADTLFFLSSASYSHRNVSGQSSNSFMFLYNGSSVAQYIFGDIDSLDDRPFIVHYSFNPPIECPATWYVAIFSGRANMWVYGSVHGWTIPV